jgi:hypothetical protein
MPLTTEQLQKHFGQVERHVVETKAHVARQQQIVRELSLRKESLLKSDLREDAAKMLAILEDSLRNLEQHRELIRSWLERGE